MPLSGRHLELYTSKIFRHFMLENARPDDLMQYLIADGIFNENDKDLVEREKTRRAKVQQILFFVKTRIDSLEPFVKVLGRNLNSYREAIETLGFAEQDLETDPQSPVTSILKNAQFRNFMLRYGILADFIPPLRAQNILSENDQVWIESQAPSNQINALFDMLLTRLSSLDPLIEAMGKTPATYGPALKIVADAGIETVHVPSSLKLDDIVEHVKKCYRDRLATFKAMPFYPTVLNICSIWINLRLENKSESTEPQNYKDAIVNALKQSPLVLLKGDPGMGKSMTQTRLAYDWAIGNLPEYDLVLCARFRDIQKNWKTIWDLVLDWMKERGYLLQQHVQWLQNKVAHMSAEPKIGTNGCIHVLCVLDGFDEARTDCKQLETWFRCNQMPFLTTAVIVTSRPVALKNIHCPLPAMTFIPLNDEQVNDYITKYLRALRAENIEVERSNLFAKINQYNIVHLAQIPLLLSCLCFVRDQICSASVVDIYLTICQALVDRQESLKGKIRFTHMKLSDICLKSPSIRALSEMCLSAVIGTEGFKPGTMMFTDNNLKRFGVDKNLWLKVGLLNADGEERVTLYEFPHATFVEFFAAAATFKHLALVRYEYPVHSVCGTSVYCTWIAYGEWRQQQRYYAIIAIIVTTVSVLVVEILMALIIEPDILLISYGIFFSALAFLLLLLLILEPFVHRFSNEPPCLKSKRLRQVFEAVKPWSLKKMWKFVFEMAAQSKEGSNTTIYNTISFLVAWSRTRNIQLSSDDRILQLLLRLLPRTTAVLKKALAKEIIKTVASDHTPSSLLSTASQAQSPMYKINDDAVCLHDLDIAVFMRHNCKRKMGQIPTERILRLCLVEQSVLFSLARTYSQMGWQQISCLKVHVTENPVEQQVTQAQTIRIKVNRLHFSFNLNNQSSINLSPLFSRCSSMNAEKIILESASSLTINDLPKLFSKEQLKNQIVYIKLDKVQFQDNDSATMFGEEMKHFRNLFTFELHCSKIGGPQLLQLVDNLSCCRIRTLEICHEPCLEDASIANELVCLLAKFPKLRRLRLSRNNLCATSIDRFCAQIEQMHKLEEVLLLDENVYEGRITAVSTIAYTATRNTPTTIMSTETSGMIWKAHEGPSRTTRIPAAVIHSLP